MNPETKHDIFTQSAAAVPPVGLMGASLAGWHGELLFWGGMLVLLLQAGYWLVRIVQRLRGKRAAAHVTTTDNAHL